MLVLYSNLCKVSQYRHCFNYFIWENELSKIIWYYEMISTDARSQTLSGKISKNRSQNIGIETVIIPAYSVTCIFLSVCFMSLNIVTLWKLWIQTYRTNFFNWLIKVLMLRKRSESFCTKLSFLICDFKIFLQWPVCFWGKKIFLS